MGFEFFKFDAICDTAALIVCPLLGGDNGIQPSCYSRNIEIAGTIIFQPGLCLVLRHDPKRVLMLYTSCRVFAYRSYYHGHYHGLPHSIKVNGLLVLGVWNPS